MLSSWVYFLKRDSGIVAGVGEVVMGRLDGGWDGGQELADCEDDELFELGPSQEMDEQGRRCQGWPEEWVGELLGRGRGVRCGHRVDYQTSSLGVMTMKIVREEC